MDEGLLEEFESELAEEEKSRKTRVAIVMIGLAAGILVGLYLTFFGWDFGGNGPTVDTGPVAQVSQDEPKAEPTPEPVPMEVVAVSNSQEEEALKPSKSEEPEEEKFSAPDILVTDKPMEAASETMDKDFSFDPLPEDEDYDNPLRDIHKDVDREVDREKEVVEKTKKKTASLATKEIKPKPVAKPAKKIPVKRAFYAVRISATTDAVLALKVRDNLKRNGYKAWISQGKVRQDIFRVIAGEFKSIKEASALSVKLAKTGFRPRTSYIQMGSKVTLEMGVYKTIQQARKVVRLMKKKGFNATIKSSGAGAMDLYVVLVGKYSSLAQAQRVEKRISDTGQRTLGVAKAK